MHKSSRPVGLALALLLITLTQPAHNAGAVGLHGSDKEPTPSTPTPPAQQPIGGYFYLVQPTDTLWDIAVAHGIRVEALVAANKLTDPRLLRPGQTIFIPARPPAAPQKPRAAAATGTSASAPSPEAGPMPGSPAAPITETITLPPEIAGWASEILALANEKRAAQGLAALKWSPELARAAQAHAEDCARRNQGSHMGSDGAKLPARLARAGYAARSASENWANAQNAQHAFGMWWNEPRDRGVHRYNILDPRYREIGIGIATGRWGYYFIADFGSR